MFQNCHVLIICTVWPEPDSSAAGKRMLELIDVFLDAGSFVTLACDAKETAHSHIFSETEINCISIELNHTSVDSVLKDLMPDVVMFDRFMSEEKYGWRITEQCPNAIKILDTEDLHFLRKARQECFKLNKIFAIDDVFTEVAKREIASIYRCDMSLIISPYEMELLKNIFKIDSSLLHYRPFLVNPLTKRDTEKWPTFKEREHFVTIGNFLHEPNVNSVLYLKENIWPLIKTKIPHAQLHIYGAYANDKINSLNNSKDGFLIKGRAISAFDVISKARVMLAPIRVGAGLKGKLLEAMLCGTPSITTTIGAEGMHEELPWNGYIIDDVKELANNAVTLYEDERIWNEAQTNGIDIVNKLFDRKLHVNVFLDALNSVKNNLSMHRQKNFIGSMLMHHTLSSTKYMARWIEEKNKANS